MVEKCKSTKNKEPACPYCEPEIADSQFPYCQACHKTELYCPECHQPVSRDEKKCPKCGAKIK